MTHDLFRWQDYPCFQSLHDQLARLMDDLGESARRPRFAPAADVALTDDAALIRLDLPGVAEADVDIRTHGNAVHVEGTRSAAAEVGERLLRAERGAGRFARTFQLPFVVDGERVKAVLKNGVLTITAPPLVTRRDERQRITVE